MRSTRVSDLARFFKPRSVAVLGASVIEGTVGKAITVNLVSEFKGLIYPVNPKYDEVLGLKAYKSCKDLPETPDLIVVAVPAKIVPQVLEECGSRGTKAAIVISAGFKETGEEGEKLERMLVDVARKLGIRVVGPNCLGVYDAHSRLNTIFNPPDRQKMPPPGNVAFLSQSGALGAAILDWLAEYNIGMSKFVSYGNAADVKEWELIEYLVEDPETKVIMMYIEGVEDGRSLLKAVRKATVVGKPVIVLKAGKSEKGVRAVSSHTGSLAGSYKVYEAGLTQNGALVVNELDEFILAAKALSWLPAPHGDRVAIVTNGGGAGVLTTDAVELLGLHLAELSEETKTYLRSKLPPAASVNNPVDILGDAPPERYEVAIEAVMRDENVDLVIVIGIMQSPAFKPSEVLESMKRLLKKYKKPTVFVAPGGEYTVSNLKKIESEARIPTFKSPEEAAKAYYFLTTWYKSYRVLKSLGVA
ncbi:MAG: acetate--CoA ligase family protein [Thermoprotei archaeon]